LSADASQNGPFAITVTATDGNGGTIDDTFTLTVSNVVPVAVDDAATAVENVTPTTGNVLTNDSDGGADTDTLIVSQVDADADNVGEAVAGDNGGLITIASDGSYTFAQGTDFDDLADGESRVTAIDYQISDGQGGLDTATLSITVTGVNDAPVVATPTDDITAIDGETLTIAAGDAFSDVDVTDVLSYTAAGLPAGLAINATTGEITGTLSVDASQNGPFAITVTATDGKGGTIDDTFTLTVSNVVPVAVDDAATAVENVTPTTGNVLTNDSDGGIDSTDSDVLVVSQVDADDANVGQAVAGTNGGLITIASDGSYTFAQGTDFDDLADGETRVTAVDYQISDGQGGLDTATLSITVTGVNDAPVAVQDTNATTENTAVSGDVLLNDSDVDASDILTVSQVGEDADSVGQPTAGDNGGQFTINADGSYDFAPGTDFDDLVVDETRISTISYQVSDGQGGVDTATLSITVTGVNDAPVAVQDTNATTENTAVSGDVLLNDSDVDASDILTVSQVGEDADSVGQPTAGDNGGQFTINADGSYDFAPGTDFDDLAVDETRISTISYQVSDGQGGVDTATLS
ncbi:beta strand repeat-containing protein, partial [Cobetia crustatorum]